MDELQRATAGTGAVVHHLAVARRPASDVPIMGLPEWNRPTNRDTGMSLLKRNVRSVVLEHVAATSLDVFVTEQLSPTEHIPFLKVRTPAASHSALAAQCSHRQRRVCARHGSH